MNQKSVFIILPIIVVMFFVSTIYVSVNATGFWAQMGFTAAQYILFFVVFLIYWHQKEYEDLSLGGMKSGRNIMISVVLSLLCLAVFFFVVAGFDEFLKLLGRESSESSLIISDFGMYIAAVVVLALLPAIIEELIFRGVVLKGLSRYGMVAAVLGSAILFSLFHLSPTQTIFQFILGIVFAVIVIRTGKIVYAMILHFINNFIIVTYTYIAGTSVIGFSWSAEIILLAVGLLIVGVGLIIWLLRSLKREKEFEVDKRENFWSVENFGFAICVILMGVFWIAVF